MTLTPTVDPFARPAGNFNLGALRPLLRARLRAGGSLPALGLVLLNAGRYGAASHAYTATLRPRATADVPSPPPVFQDRGCHFFRRPDGQGVLVVPWGLSDLAVPGAYRIQVRAVAGSGLIEYLPEVLLEVAA